MIDHTLECVKNAREAYTEKPTASNAMLWAYLAGLMAGEVERSQSPPEKVLEELVSFRDADAVICQRSATGVSMIMRERSDEVGLDFFIKGQYFYLKGGTASDYRRSPQRRKTPVCQPVQPHESRCTRVYSCPPC